MCERKNLLHDTTQAPTPASINLNQNKIKTWCPSNWIPTGTYLRSIDPRRYMKTMKLYTWWGLFEIAVVCGNPKQSVCTLWTASPLTSKAPSAVRTAWLIIPEYLRSRCESEAGKGSFHSARNLLELESFPRTLRDLSVIWQEKKSIKEQRKYLKFHLFKTFFEAVKTFVPGWTNHLA